MMSQFFALIWIFTSSSWSLAFVG